MHIDSNVAAVVTGGASGLGEATARALSARGVKVAIFDRDETRGPVAASAIGGTYCAVDITDEASVVAGFAKARAANGQERILVNCAGIGGGAKTVSRSREDGSILEYPMDNFHRIVAVNLTGTFRCIVKAAAGMLTLDPMADGERGAIVNTASVAAEDGQVGQVAYAASKGGVVGMTLPIARDLASEAIRVNTILPGIFETPLLARVPDKAREGLASSVPFPRRLGAPGEYAQLALAIIENGYFNGEDVRLDGAIRMAPR
jgi:NAD(P)-dependent dehydrogenase (short-subunit alcohol dehydrogenase family)